MKIKLFGLNKKLLPLIWFVIPAVGVAFEVTVVDPGPEAQQEITVRQVKTVYPRATAEDVVCGKAHHMTRFRLNDKHAGLSFSIAAKKMTRIKVRWDHPDKVMFPQPEKKKTIIFPHAGGVSHLYFRAYQPVSGNVYIMNDHDVVIKACPYSFLPAKHYRQSINMSLNGVEYDRLDNTLDNNSNNVSVNYRISSKNVVPDGGYWSLSVGVSQSEGSTNSRRINGSVSYSW